MSAENPSALPLTPTQGREEKKALFRRAWFTLHSGQQSEWKIDCDALTEADWVTLALMVSERVSAFGAVEGVPSGGLKLASALRRFTSAAGPLLIVDDVLTTGASMEAHRAGRDAIGAVVFARGRCPSWVTPLFTMWAAQPDPSRVPPAQVEATDADEILHEWRQYIQHDWVANATKIEDWFWVLKRLRDRLASSLSGSSQSQPEGWQDISTAPKDGTWILSLDAEESPQQEVVRWTDSIEGSTHTWRCSEDYVRSPTHWQPLPPVPQTGARRG